MDKIELINQVAADYALAHTSPTDELLQEIERYTLQEHARPIMLSGPLQGKFLEMISLIMRPDNILEIGTFTGYSALCLAKGLSPDGRLHTLEIRKEDAEISKSFFERSLYNKQIHLHVGNAIDILPDLDLEWDIVFIDADKDNYIHYYELTLPRLKTNGLIMVDNVLFHGKVLEDKIKGKSAQAIHAFNDHVRKDTRVQQVMLTVRDGLMLIRKK